MNDSLLQMNTFFPNELMAIESIEQDNCTVHIKLRSRTHSCKCPECGCETTNYHGTYLRKVQDLPFLGKTT